jgi:hypothetical protein
VWLAPADESDDGGGTRGAAASSDTSPGPAAREVATLALHVEGLGSLVDGGGFIDGADGAQLVGGVPRARALADRTYSRRKAGAPQFVPPGRCLVLLASHADALWGGGAPGCDPRRRGSPVTAGARAFRKVRADLVVPSFRGHRPGETGHVAGPGRPIPASATYRIAGVPLCPIATRRFIRREELPHACVPVRAADLPLTATS